MVAIWHPYNYRVHCVRDSLNKSEHGRATDLLLVKSLVLNLHIYRYSSFSILSLYMQPSATRCGARYFLQLVLFAAGQHHALPTTLQSSRERARSTLCGNACQQE